RQAALAGQPDCFCLRVRVRSGRGNGEVCMTRPFRAAFIAMITAVCVVLFAGYVFGQDPLRDPFEAYSAVMPNEPRPTDGGWRCETEFTQPQPQGYFYCFLLVRQPALRWVSVSGANGVISRTGFGVNLRYGDL